ncbi:hypothetical protein CLV91_0422 [Maribacter vaceletii]|uniref:DUF1680 family protein n=1 Tax=Maribacter vaceletii TaxID=1206816 RepID=A0A495EEN6_9FLAO|nr:glycoside hydrolase family 127 protein [Maribacter vaceletii]RKR14347.1 hypothetical protein CLV91_0422 [Maribacter vaceletii]
MKTQIKEIASPYFKLQKPKIDACQWTDGFWAQKLELCHTEMIPNLGRLMDDPKIIHAYENFKVAAGLAEGEFKGWPFHDGDFYKYLEALSHAYAISKDEKINALLDEKITVIAKAQRKDGYLGTYITIGHGTEGFGHPSEFKYKDKTEAFQIDFDHEFYNFGHLMTSACAHYNSTGKTNFLDIAIKASNHLYDRFGELSPELAYVDWNPPHYMGLVEMYRTTGDKKYLELAESFVNMRGNGEKGKNETRGGRGLDHSQKRTPIRDEKQAVGHAGHANYLYCGVTDVYGETGDCGLWDALERIWKNVTTRKMYITGATGPHHFGLSDNLDFVCESYGKEYELPNIKAYNETCANIGNAMWNYRMFRATGEARFMDIVELVFYNSALSGIALDGKHYCYTNPLRFIEGHPQNTKDNGARSTSLSVFCCPPNIIRTIAQLQTYAYSISKKGVWVNLYGSNVINTELEDGSAIQLTQQTNYPWDGKISISVEAEKKDEFAIMLRIPAWAKEVSLKINGKPIKENLVRGSYFELSRTWTSGDTVELNLPMSPVLMAANPAVEETRNQVAIKRGPLVYCLEAIDLPSNVKLSEISIPNTINLTPIYDEKLLSGVTVLEGEALVTKETQDWNTTLYQELDNSVSEKSKIKFVPYYAWNNRGSVDMSVWLPSKN